MGRDEFPSGKIRLFWNQIVVRTVQHRDHTECHGIVHVKMVNFM